MNTPAMTFLFLTIPTMFALAMLGQGIYKITKEEKDGPVATGFGIFFLVLIVVIYFLLIK